MEKMLEQFYMLSLKEKKEFIDKCMEHYWRIKK